MSEYKKPKLSRVTSIFLRRKLREVTVDVKEGWLKFGMIVVAAALFITGAFLGNKYPTFEKWVKYICIGLGCVVVLLIAVVFIAMFCSWIRNNWKESKIEAREELYPGVPSSCDNDGLICWKECDIGPYNSDKCFHHRRGLKKNEKAA